MMAESKAASSSMPPYSRGIDKDDQHSVNYAAENTSDGGQGGRESIDITKSHFGESGMSEFHRTQKAF